MQQSSLFRVIDNNKIKDVNYSNKYDEEGENINIKKVEYNKRKRETFINQNKNHNLNYASYDAINNSFCPQKQIILLNFELKKYSFIVYANKPKCPTTV